MSNVCVSDGVGWYALYVRYRSEFRIVKALSDRFGVLADVPSTKVWRRGSRRVGIIIKPLLDTYVFVKANISKLERSQLLMVDGVIDLIRINGAPAVIPEDQIESLRKLSASHAPVHEMEYRGLKPCSPVMVTRGPMVGAIGTFICGNAGKGIFMVNLDLFRRTLVTEIDPNAIKLL